jgi:DNA gyrase/topoisomerase IV subunit B
MDADSDGHHITTLLLTFFYRFLPDLIQRGHVFIAQPPLFKVMWGKDRYWAGTDRERDDLIRRLKKKDPRKSLEISRFKGLGEMMADTLKETTLDPKTRTLIQVEIPKGLDDLTDQTIADLMGKDASKRYDIIVQNLGKVDDLDL